MTDLVYTELISQPYQNCVISAGMVEGHPVDTLYLRFDRNDESGLTILLRPDEMAAIAHCAAYTLWSILEVEVRPSKEQK